MKLTISSLLLTLCLLTCTANSVEVTTGNLLPNANDGVDWGSSSTDQIHPDSGSGYVTNGSTVNGFDVTCTNQSNCGYKYSVGGDFEVTGDTTLSVEDVGLTNNSITQSMLDNGVTLNSYIDVANCESTEGNCESKGGSNDTHTTTIVLKDSSGNVLSTTTQTRNEVTGFQGNCNGYPGSSATGVTAACGQYNDTVIHNDVGANKFNWSWQGVDSNYTNQSRQGPNLLGARVTMTYNNTEYDPIDEDAQEAIDDINENIPDIEDDFTWEEDFYFEEEYFTWEEDFYFEEDFIIEDEYIVGDWEMDYEMEFNEDMYFEEEFVEMEMPEEFEEFDMTMMPEEEFVDMYFEEEFDEGAFMEMPEEFEEMELSEEFEDMPREMEEEFTEMEMEEEFEEMEVMEEEPTEMEVVEEEETIDMETETEEDVVEMEAEEEEMEVAENDDSIQEPEEDEESSEGTEEAVEEEPESEEGVSETVENEKETMEETDVADEGGITTKNIEVSKEIKIKNVDVGEIKISIDPRDIFKEVVNLDSYSNKDFYQDKGLQYEVNDDFFDQLSMIEYSKEIYKGVTLVTYIQGDPIEIYKQELEELAIQKAGIMIELKLLRGE
jgi:hypothetical protein